MLQVALRDFRFLHSVRPFLTQEAHVLSTRGSSICVCVQLEAPSPADSGSNFFPIMIKTLVFIASLSMRLERLSLRSPFTVLCLFPSTQSCPQACVLISQNPLAKPARIVCKARGGISLTSLSTSVSLSIYYPNSTMILESIPILAWNVRSLENTQRRKNGRPYELGGRGWVGW